MADQNDMTQNVTLWDNAKSTNVTVTTDGSKERLDVDAKISDFPPTSNRVEEPVQEGEFNNTSRNKIEYTVPASKVLYITSVTSCLGNDGGGIYIEWQEDGTAFHAHRVSDDGTQFCHSIFTDGNPYGPFAAGVEIRARRVTGDSGKDWSASFLGYLEDA